MPSKKSKLVKPKPQLTDVQTTYIEAKRNTMADTAIAKALKVGLKVVREYIAGLPEASPEPTEETPVDVPTIGKIMLKQTTEAKRQRGIAVMNKVASELGDDARKARGTKRSRTSVNSIHKIYPDD